MCYKVMCPLRLQPEIRIFRCGRHAADYSRFSTHIVTLTASARPPPLWLRGLSYTTLTHKLVSSLRRDARSLPVSAVGIHAKGHPASVNRRSVRSDLLIDA